MYKYKLPKSTTLVRNTSYVGERIEQKIARILNNKTPITDGAPLIYTDRKEGVMAATNIRTDRFEIAVDAMDRVHKDAIAKRESKAKTLGEQANEGMKTEKIGEGGAQSIHGTGGTGESK